MYLLEGSRDIASSTLLVQLSSDAESVRVELSNHVKSAIDLEDPIHVGPDEVDRGEKACFQTIFEIFKSGIDHGGKWHSLDELGGRTAWCTMYGSSKAMGQAEERESERGTHGFTTRDWNEVERRDKSQQDERPPDVYTYWGSADGISQNASSSKRLVQDREVVIELPNS